MRYLFPLFTFSSLCACALLADSLTVTTSRVLIPERLGTGAATVTVTLDPVPVADVEVTIANTNLTRLSSHVDVFPDAARRELRSLGVSPKGRDPLSPHLPRLPFTRNVPA